MNIVDKRGRLPTHSWKKYGTRPVSNIRSAAIHHSLTKTGSAESFANYHVKTNLWPGIAYAYVINRDGTIDWCWDWNILTYHVGDSNGHALGICMVGDFRTQMPTPEQYASAIQLVRFLQAEIPSALQVKGHSEYPGYAWKSCPVINMDKFREDVRGMPNEHKLSANTAETVIKTWIQKSWQHANSRMIEEKKKGNTAGEAAWRRQRDYYHHLANDLRKAAGIETNQGGE